MKTWPQIIVFALLAACSGTENGDTTNCPAGTSYNPITGACAAGSANNAANSQNNNGSNQTTATTDTGNDGGNGTPDTGKPPRDLGTPPDMPRPPVDMGGPPPDMNMPPAVTRFIAIGDQGTGSQTQINVALAIGTVCQSLGGCEFGLLLGDNIYDTGVSSANDTLFMSHFEIPYGGLGFPFYAVLGNHDLGGDGLGIDLDQNKADYQIDYGAINPMWIMPARHYDFSRGPLHFVALDTTRVFFGTDSAQRANVPGLIANAGSRWKIAFGHHPFYSNGPHGNAGEYEGLPFIPIANGEHVRSFMEDHICGKVDFYICGHDHSRQDLVPDCQGTQFIVSGAGAKTTDLEGNNATHFQSDLEGFLLVEATNTTFMIRFYDENGVMNHERTVTR